MNPEILFVFALLVVTVGLFIADRIRMDLVAMMVVVALMLSGVVTPSEAVSGFGQSIVVMIAGLFVVGEGLFRTGVAAAVGTWVLRIGGNSERRLLLTLIPVVAGLSAFMSSTGAVALFIPVVLSICRKASLQPSRLLMPMAFASLIGGMLTLIGTPPNIVVSGQLENAGLAAFGFFDFTFIGGLVLLLGTLYLVFVAPRLLPEGPPRESEHPRLEAFAERYGIRDHLHKLHLPAGSRLVGKTVVEAGLRTYCEVTLFGIRRAGRWLTAFLPVLSESTMAAGDNLMVFATPEDVQRLCQESGAQLQGFPRQEQERAHQEFGVAEVMLHQNSPLLGRTIKEGRFRERFNLSVIGVMREGVPILAEFNGTPLRFGDSLLLVGSWRYIAALDSKREFVVLETPAELEEVPSRGHQAPIALAIMLAMLVLMVSGVASSLTAVMLAVLAMIITGCVTMDESYKSLNGSSLVLIAGMLPLALAMKKSGGLQLIVDQMLSLLGDSGPLLICAALFVFTSVFSQFISNTATTVLVAPVALAIAQGLGLNPEPFLMTVAIAASTAFATPIASPVNTLVLVPGNYQFRDFVRVGVPLQLIAMVITLLVTPWLFPF
ncbi:MAG: SLC13 family permease [Motiliproteus sp.]